MVLTTRRASTSCCWPLTLGLSIAALVAVGSVAVGLWRGGGAWAALLAARGGIALLGATAIIEYVSGEGSEANRRAAARVRHGCCCSSAAGVFAMLRDG